MTTAHLFHRIFFLLFLFTSSVSAQVANRPTFEIFNESDRYESEQRKALSSSGKRYDNAAKENVQNDRRALAKKYALEIEGRPNISGKDLYYLARIYSIAENDKKTLESMQRYIASVPDDAIGDMIKSALSFIVVLASRDKQLDVAEKAYQRFITTEPVIQSQRPALQDYLASAYFKESKFEQAIGHAQSAFDLLKTLTPKTVSEKRSRETIYMNLVEVLALGYKRNKNTDQSLSILAEARAQSFTIPSANLYRKVMDFVQGSGFSEKKMMQKIDSYASADPAPEIAITEWIGRESTSLEGMRGKVVLLDFWATWCGPCIATFPRLRGWHKKFGGENFEIIGVTQYYGEQDGKRVTPLQEIDYLREFRQKYKMPYGIAVANSGEAQTKYGIAAYPTTILLDRNGVVRYIGIGAGTEESANLEETIEKVLKESSHLGSN